MLLFRIRYEFKQWMLFVGERSDFNKLSVSIMCLFSKVYNACILGMHALHNFADSVVIGSSVCRQLILCATRSPDLHVSLSESLNR